LVKKKQTFILIKAQNNAKKIAGEHQLLQKKILWIVSYVLHLDTDIWLLNQDVFVMRTNLYDVSKLWTLSE